MSDLLDDLIEAWGIHNHLLLYLVDWLPEEGLQAVTLLKTGQPARGRNVARILSHLHEVRCSKLESSAAGVAGVPRFAGSYEGGQKELRQALELSGQLVAGEVRSAVEESRSIKGWKRSPAVWIAYLIAHESHHRGQIAQALKQSGVRPPQEISYSSWGYWGGYKLTPL